MELSVDSYVPRDRLATSKDKARRFVGRLAKSGRDFLAANMAANGVPDLVPALNLPPAGKPVVAEVNHGRWIANCECGGAEVVDPSDPIFFCLSCMNAENGRLPRLVEFPEEKRRREIEAMLIHRHERRSRAWLPQESLETLKMQNRARGDRED